MPSTRERLQTSFAPAAALAGDGNGEAIRAPVPVGGQDIVQAAVPEPVLPAAPLLDGLTTRDRIVNRAAAAPTAEQEPAEAARERTVVDLSEERDRRRQRAGVEAPAAPEASLAPVLVLAPRPSAGPAPARADVVATAAPARAPPAPRPEESGAPPRAGPEAEGAPARAGPELAPEGAAAPEPAPGTAPEGGAPESPAPAAGGVPSAEPPGAEAVGAPAAEPPAAQPTPAATQPVVLPEQPSPPEGAAAPAPVLRVIRNPEDEPGFQAMKARTGIAAVRTKRHQPGRQGAETAQGASQPDQQKDVDSQAATDHVEAMGEQEPGPFDAAKFKLDVKAKVEAMAPPATLEEADEFESSGRAGQATSWLQQLVTGGKAASENDIKVTTESPADPEGKEPKPVSEMDNDAPGPRLPEVGAAAALPGQRPPSEIDVSAGPLEVEAKMTEANVTEEQLASANEPSFTAALDARQEVREHAATDPGTYRTHEELVLARGRVEAENVAGTQLEGMHASRLDTLSNVLGVKNKTKTADEQLRDDVHQAILDIHERTRADVTSILETLDTTVDDIFTSSEKAARDHFEEYVARKMSEYKADRYSGLFGGARWAKDKIFDLPDEVNEFYRQGREDYLAAMDQALDLIASVVGILLGAAQLRVQAGREEVRSFVEGLDGSVRKLGEDTAADLDNGFDQLSSDVDAKRDELVDAVAHKYVEARDDLDARIKELQEANKGLVSKAIDAVVGVIKTIYELTKLLVRVLLKAASAIGDIVAHPIRFLENLVGAVKGGLERFIERFPVHLQESLLDLLFGELGSAGITMPAQLDFAGIVDLVLQVLGLTYANIRDRVAKRFGEDVVVQMEQKVDVFQRLLKDGVGGLWTWIREKLTDLEDLVVGKIKEYVEERVVRAGIGYVIALLNPAAAFIKACQGIYQIVMFIVERAKQIADFVDAVLDSISAIAQGNVGAAVEKIDSALAGALTLAIGFLARLANLGALSEKVRSIIALVRRPITRVVDTVVLGAAQLYRRTLGPAIAFGKAKVQSGMDWAKGKAAQGKARAARKLEAVKVRFTGREPAHELPATAEPPAHEDDVLAQPVKVAEDSVDVAPDEHHTVFALLASGGQIYIGTSSTPQLVTDLVGHYEPRIDSLPVTAPARLPKGGREGDRPRMQARAAAGRIVKQAAKLDLDFEHDVDARRALHHAASFKGFASVYRPAPGLTSRLAKLGGDVQVLLRMFYAYDKPQFLRVEDEPARGQKLTGRVWVRPGPRGEILPEGGARGVDPTRPRRFGFDFLAPDPHLAVSTRGAVREGAAERARGIVHLGAPRAPPDQREVVVRSWAIGGKPDRGSNASHTETQFYNWLKAQGDDFHQRVAAIELRSALSPCGDCTALLTGIAKLVRNRPPGTPAPSLIVFWDTVYGNEEGDVGPAAATFRRHVVYLGDAGWVVHGPTPPA